MLGAELTKSCVHLTGGSWIFTKANYQWMSQCFVKNKNWWKKTLSFGEKMVNFNGFLGIKSLRLVDVPPVPSPPWPCLHPRYCRCPMAWTQRLAEAQASAPGWRYLSYQKNPEKLRCFTWKSPRKGDSPSKPSWLLASKCSFSEGSTKNWRTCDRSLYEQMKSCSTYWLLVPQKEHQLIIMNDVKFCLSNFDRYQQLLFRSTNC